MKNKLILLLLIVPFYLFSQTAINTDYKIISGRITHENKVLENQK